MILTPKLRKLLMMMTSEHPNEVIAARNRITEVLRSMNKDWHDLLGAVSTNTPGPSPFAQQPYSQPRQGKRMRSYVKVRKTMRPEPSFFDERPAAPKEAPRTTPKRTTFPEEGERISKDEWLDLIHMAWERRANLSKQDYDFVASLLKPHFSRASGEQEPSSKQQNWFREAFKRAMQKAA